MHPGDTESRGIIFKWKMEMKQCFDENVNMMIVSVDYRHSLMVKDYHWQKLLSKLLPDARKHIKRRIAHCFWTRMKK